MSADELKGVFHDIVWVYASETKISSPNQSPKSPSEIQRMISGHFAIDPRDVIVEPVQYTTLGAAIS